MPTKKTTFSSRQDADKIVKETIAALRATNNHAGFTNQPVPVWCQQKAESAEAAGDYYLAARWFGAASACTAGHSRAAMYDNAEEKCLRIATGLDESK